MRDRDVPLEQAREERRRATASRAGKPNGKAEEHAKVRFPLVPFDKIAIGTGSSYLVKGLIPREGLVVVWGPPKCGKSFWILDLMMHVALGWEYRGRRVMQGPVIYVACEGERGLAARVEAFRRAKMTEDGGTAPFYLLTTRLDLIAEADLLIADIKAQIGEGIQPVAVTIDTLNRSLNGSESDDRDMSAYIKAADRIRETFKCAVIVIHHCGIVGTRPRGHTSLLGAADAQIAVRRNPAGQVVTAVECMKDGPEGEETCSTLSVVDVGTDEDGEAITSCCVEPADAAAEAPRKRTPPSAQRALDLLKNAIAEAGMPAPANNHIPAEAICVAENLWRAHCYAGQIAMSGTPDAKQKAFARAASALVRLGIIGKWNEFIWLC